MNSSLINGGDISTHEPVADAVEKGEHHSKINSSSGMTNIEKNDTINENGDGQNKILYSERWWILVTILMVDIVNRGHCIAFASVTNKSAKYYDQPGDRIDLIVIVSYAVGVPCFIICAYVVEAWGLKLSLKFGAILTGIGGGLCCISSFYYIWDEDGVPKGDTRFYLALFGQALTGIANPFIITVPTKVSQHWFGENERALATILMTMCPALGHIIALVSTPFLVPTPDYIPVMNIIWFIPAAVALYVCIWKVKSDYPPTPPSLSAALEIKSLKERRLGVSTFQRWLSNNKELAKNKSFVLMVLVLSSMGGYNIVIISKMEQFMCARGYSNQLAGFTSSSFITSVILASVPVGLIATKIKKEVQVSKMLLVASTLASSAFAYLVTVPGHASMLITLCILMGATASITPIMFEMIAEFTYPIDQCTSFSLLLFANAIQGTFLMALETILYRPLSEDEMEVQTCADIEDTAHEQAKDYLPYTIFVQAYATVFLLIYVFLFHPEMKRSKVDKSVLQNDKVTTGIVSIESESFVHNHVKTDDIAL